MMWWIVKRKDLANSVEGKRTAESIVTLFYVVYLINSSHLWWISDTATPDLTIPDRVWLVVGETLIMPDQTVRFHQDWSGKLKFSNTTQSHTGEFTLPTLNAFNPTQHVKLSNISNRTDQNNLEVTVFHLLKTKLLTRRWKHVWSHQDSITDPKATLNNHLWTNNPPMDRLLFAYRHARGLCPLTKKVFLDWINTIAVSLGEDNLKGHRIWNGGTLEFLLWGMLWCLEISGPLDKWSFHTLPLPACDNYIQNYLILEEFMFYTMPCTREHWYKWVAPPPPKLGSNCCTMTHTSCS